MPINLIRTPLYIWLALPAADPCWSVMKNAGTSYSYSCSFLYMEKLHITTKATLSAGSMWFGYKLWWRPLSEKAFADQAAV